MGLKQDGKDSRFISFNLARHFFLAPIRQFNGSVHRDINVWVLTPSLLRVQTELSEALLRTYLDVFQCVSAEQSLMGVNLLMQAL